MLTTIINHFSKPGSPPHVTQSAVFAASLYKWIPEVDAVILVDGSQKPDPQMAAHGSSLGFQYIHSGRQLSFAEGFNLGLEYVHSDFVLLSASDIYPNGEAVRRLLSFAEAADSLGCAIPSLTYSDLGSQARISSKLAPHQTPLMTINVNLLHTSVLKTLGGLSTDFTGNYNDVDLAIRLKLAGLRTYVVPAARFVHYGSLSLSVPGLSDTRHDADLQRFQQKWSDWFDPRGLWQVDVGQLMASARARAIYRLLRRIPNDHVRMAAMMRLLSHLSYFQ